MVLADVAQHAAQGVGGGVAAHQHRLDGLEVVVGDLDEGEHGDPMMGTAPAQQGRAGSIQIDAGHSMKILME